VTAGYKGKGEHGGGAIGEKDVRLHPVRKLPCENDSDREGDSRGKGHYRGGKALPSAADEKARQQDAKGRKEKDSALRGGRGARSLSRTRQVALEGELRVFKKKKKGDILWKGGIVFYPLAPLEQMEVVRKSLT